MVPARAKSATSSDPKPSSGLLAYRAAMPNALRERLRAHGFQLPDYDGGGLVNVASTVLDLCGARTSADPPPLRGVDPALLTGVRNVLVVLCDGLGSDQLQRLAKAGDTPFLARVLERAARHDA